MSDYTPTTEDIESAYLYGCREEQRPGLIAEFNCWLEQVKVEALRDAADKLEAGHNPPKTDELIWSAWIGYYGEVDWLRALANEMEQGA